MKYPFVAIAYVPTNTGHIITREKVISNELDYSLFSRQFIIGNRRLKTRTLNKEEIMSIRITKESTSKEKEAYAKTVLDFLAYNSRFPEYEPFDLEDLIKKMDAEDIEQAIVVKPLCMKMLNENGLITQDSTTYGENIKLSPSGRKMVQKGFFTLYMAEHSEPIKIHDESVNVHGEGNKVNLSYKSPAGGSLTFDSHSDKSTNSTTTTTQKSSLEKIWSWIKSKILTLFKSVIIAYIAFLIAQLL